MTVDQAIQIALQHHNAGRYGQAEQIYQQILEQVPNHPDALHLLGLLASRADQQTQAIELVGRAIRSDPNSAVYHSNLGEILRKVGRLDEAEISCRRALELSPDFPLGHLNLGIVLYDRKRWCDAETSLRQAVELDTNLQRPAAVPLVHSQLEQGKFDQALEFARRAIPLLPGDAQLHNCLGRALEGTNSLEEAESEYLKALAIDPRFAEAMRNMGLIEHRRSNSDRAMEWWEKAVGVQPDHADANWNLGLGLLARGDFERGWRLFEWRSQSDRTRHLRRDYPAPRWTGFDISGKTILLHGEQGFGDVIQFSRFIPQVAARGAKVIVQVSRELTRLMKGIVGVDRAIADEDELPEFDAYQSLLSLPLVLGTTLKTLPAEVPYIQIDPHHITQWSQRIHLRPNVLKVGLAWAGRPTHADDEQRSIALKTLRPLADVTNVKFFGLQKGEAAGQVIDAPFEMTDLSEYLDDFLETAAAIANLNLVIGIDSAVIHLAGAIGAPVWTLLPFTADYRWMLDRQDSPWYPTMRLFRQSARGQWETPIARIVQALRTFETRA